MPPSGQWSSTVSTRPRRPRPPSMSVAVSSGLTEYRSMTRAAMPSAASVVGRLSASTSVMPAATIVSASSSDWRSTRLPPIVNSSSGP